MEKLNTFKLISIFLILTVIISACSSPKPKESNSQKADQKQHKTEIVKLNISAAISLTDALEDIKTIYEKDNDVKLSYIFGGSGKLAQQIQQGAPVDVFLSANQDWMDLLEKEDLLINETRANITGNKIVLIAGKDSSINYKTFEELNASELQQVAVGNPESVPAGQYTEQLLKTLNKWAELEPKIVFAQDVRQVLTYVETGNVDVGFVYESDALTSKKIKILATANSNLHDPVIYPTAVLKDSKHEKEAASFVKFMASKEAQNILEKHGFRK